MGMSPNSGNPPNQFLPKQRISRIFFGGVRIFFETYMIKINKTSFSSALKKAASRARIKEGRTACKQTLRSGYTFMLSGCNRGK